MGLHFFKKKLGEITKGNKFKVQKINKNTFFFFYK